MVLDNFIVDAPIVWDRVGKKIFENPHVKQGRKMRVQITNAGMVEDLSGYALALGWKHTVSGVDGLDVFEDGSEANVGIFEMAYTENLMTNLGNLKASLVLTSVEDMVVAESNDFYVKVDNSPFGADAEQGVGSYTRLAEILLNEESRIVAEVARVSAEETRVTDFNALVDSEIIAQNVATKFQAKEAEYLPRLVSNEQQLADIELNKADLADLPSSAYVFKGSTTFALLPATLNALGDVYYVTDGTPQNYAWTGTAWTPIGNGALADKSITNGKIADKTITKIKLNPTAISKYPFQPNANFDLVKSNVHYDAYELNNALLDIELYGADLDEDYYINSLYSGYITSLSGNRTYVGVKRRSDDVTVCQYAQAVLHTADSAVVFMLSALNGSGITGKATVNFSKIGLMGTIGDIQTHNYAPNFDSLGLSKECIKNGNTKTALDTKLSNVSYAQVTSKPVDALSIVAPSVVHGVVGHNTNINLDNVLLNGDYYNAERFILTSCGTVEGEHERIPTVAGEVRNQFRYYLGDTLYKSKDLTFKTVADTAGSGTTKKIIIIGDSTTDSGVPSAELLNLFDTDVMNVELLGTRGTAPALHEGRSGWTTTDYLTVTESNGSTNAFYNPGTSAFDFSYYMTQQGYAGVDAVIINLGINDRNESIPEATVVANYTTMINSIKAYNPNIKIIVALTNTCSRWPNQWGYTGGTGRKNGILVMIKALLTAFENRENENIFIAPVHMYLNPFWDMQYAEMALSSRNTKTFFYGVDNSHPSTVGYNKVADCYYNVLKYIASLG